MPPDSRIGPAATPGRSREDSDLAAEASHTVADLAAWRQHRAWARAVAWLHDHGLPAAVPCGARVWLRAHGIEADWYYRGPCGCGSDGCWVLAAEGEAPPPEIHVCTGSAR